MKRETIMAACIVCCLYCSCSVQPKEITDRGFVSLQGEPVCQIEAGKPFDGWSQVHSWKGQISWKLLPDSRIVSEGYVLYYCNGQLANIRKYHRLYPENPATGPDEQPDSAEDDINPSGKENKPTEQPKPADPDKHSCRLVWVTDVPYRAEEGHYETVYHPDEYEDRMACHQQLFYWVREPDGTYSEFDSLEQMRQYRSQLKQKGISSNYGTDYRDICQLVKTLVSPAYTEKVWVVDVSAQQEIGHYEQVCR